MNGALLSFSLLIFTHFTNPPTSCLRCWRGSPSWGGTDGYKSRNRSSPTSLSSLRDDGPWRWQKVKYLRSTWFTTPCELRVKTTTTTSCLKILLIFTYYKDCLLMHVSNMRVVGGTIMEGDIKRVILIVMWSCFDRQEYHFFATEGPLPYGHLLRLQT